MDNKQLAERKRDFSTEELESLKDYRKNNMPGLTRMTESDASQYFELYMAGKTYSEIAKITSTKKDLILYVSDRCNWHNKKMQYYSDLSDNMLQKCNESKIETLNTVTTMVTALNRYFGDKFDRFLKDKDVTIIENIDTKLLAQYYKATEAMDKILGGSVGNGDSDPKSRQNPLVNVNVNGGARVTQTDENTLEIDITESEKEKAVGEILAGLSKIKKIRSNQE